MASVRGTAALFLVLVLAAFSSMPIATLRAGSDTQRTTSAERCRIDGRVTSAGTPLPACRSAFTPGDHTIRGVGRNGERIAAVDVCRRQRMYRIGGVKVSSLVVGTQLHNVDRAAGSKSPSPLVRDGIEIIPNPTHIVGHDQTIYSYYEVYDPAVESGAPRLQTSLAFYRNRVKVFETPIVERTQIDATDRRAALFQFELPAGSLTPGLYTCQVNIIDEAAGRFAFPRLPLYVR